MSAYNQTIKLKKKLYLALGFCDRASWAKCEEREKTKKMQQLDVYYQLLSQHVSGIIMSIFRRTKTVLLHLVYCSGSAGCELLASYNAAPHNRYQPHPAEPEQYTKCSKTVFVLLKMDIMMPETCWNRSW